MAFTRNSEQVKWAELLPEEFLARLDQCPIVYLPMGLCEPHGQITAFGLDTLKAEFICEQAARQAGGIVAPTQNYHVHETGYHAPWLEEVLGDTNPRMASIPPDLLLHLFLYQLRAFTNAGFRGIVVITGHSGGNQEDLRLAADAFMEKFPVQIVVKADPELVEGQFQADHAGKYEISQMMHIRPDLVDMERIHRQNEESDILGRFAIGLDAKDASPEFGAEIMDACVTSTCAIVRELKDGFGESKHRTEPIGYAPVEEIWLKLLLQRNDWTTHKIKPEQTSLPSSSKWKPYEKPFPH